ncbi:MAG: WxcM-like domain-containing protein [Nitrospirae bacterium]|nr:WxcM-like domain-containing protein [Nitrospirota bacterium]
MDYEIITTQNIKDERGKLVVFLRGGDLPITEKQFGQIYFVTFKDKNIVRGNHYHKEWEEYFGIVNGRVKAVLEDINTKERVTIILDALDKDYLRLRIGVNIAHSFQSETDSACILNYTIKEWSPNDTFSYKLL